MAVKAKKSGRGWNPNYHVEITFQIDSRTFHPQLTSVCVSIIKPGRRYCNMFTWGCTALDVTSLSLTSCRFFFDDAQSAASIAPAESRRDLANNLIQFLEIEDNKMSR